MRQLHQGLGLSFLMLLSAIALTTDYAKAQVIPDQTLGGESSTVQTGNLQGRDGVVRNSDFIEGGARREGNLFHSFGQFDVQEGRAVYFANPEGVANILGRVTGGDRSEIFGTLGVAGSANLFLINPNGIVFGSNASLDLLGSFVGTTATGLQFGDQGVFSTTDSGAPPLLRIAPSALLFNSLNNGSINHSQTAVGVAPTGSGLQVPNGRSLVLAGGGINLEGGSFNAPGGRVELAGIAEGRVGLLQVGEGFSLQVPGDGGRSDVEIALSTLNVAADTGGAIAIYARNLDMADESFLRGGIEANLGSSSSQAGDIRLDATEAIQIKERGFIGNTVRSNSLGAGGNIVINAGSLSSST